MVDWGKAGCVGRIAVACMLLVVCGGCLCRPRHGMIIRGDWSPEMNRVPWVASRSAADQECSETAIECSPACLMEGEMSAGYPCEPPTAAQPDADRTSHSAPQSGSGGRIFQRRGRSRVADSVQPAIAAAPHEHSRFHPVPTRPVFLPRPDRYAAAGNDAHRQGTDAGDSGCPWNRSAPMPPELELIPVPEPDIDEGWKARDADQDASRSGAYGRVLLPSVDLRLRGIALARD